MNFSSGGSESLQRCVQGYNKCAQCKDTYTNTFYISVDSNTVTLNLLHHAAGAKN